SAELGQPFIVENRVTSGGTVASQQVAESTPDGHTLLVTFDTFAVNKLLFKELKWDPLRDFAPLMQVCRFPQVLVVHPSLGVKSVKEFVALAQHVKAGKLVALAVSTGERSKYYPGLPSIAETYPGFDSASWGAMFAPAATPKPVLERLHATLAKLLAEPAVRERLEAQSCDIVGGTPEALTDLVKAEQAKWGPIIRDRNITVD